MSKRTISCADVKEGIGTDSKCALREACYNGFLDIVQYLVETARSNIEAVTKTGRTGLICA
jgi:hypothetical protein